MKERDYVDKVLLGNYVLLRDTFSDTDTARIYQCTKNDNLYMLETTSVKVLLGEDSSDIEDLEYALEYVTLLLEHEGIYYSDRDPKVRYVYTTGKDTEFYTVRFTTVKESPVPENCYQ